MTSVVIVNWNGKHYLSSCLISLRKQVYQDFEIIMVDNGSSDGSVDFVRENFPEVEVIESSVNLGFAAGNNLGFQHAMGEYIALLNNDAEADPRWLDELVKVLDSSEKIAGACGTMSSLEEKERVVFTLTKIDPLSAKAYWINQASEQREVDYLMGSGMLIRRSVIDQIGGLDEEYFAYFEETDWCARAIRAGYSLMYIPTAIVYHKQGGSVASEFQYYMMWRNRIRFALKNFDPAFIPGFLFSCVLDICGEMIINLRDSRGSWNKLILKAILWNLVHLSGTLKARRRDLKRIHPKRSYNRSLPLRSVKSDGKGGFRE